MITHLSEKFFEDYLNQYNLKYERDFFVEPGNVDFRVKSSDRFALCDVKAIEKTGVDNDSKLWAQRNIRKDIKIFRNKFGKNRPMEPCVLVLMNFSSMIFTGLTVARSMRGEIGYIFDGTSKEIISDAHHLPKGNASMTRRQNRSFSGVLVFNRNHNHHYLFKNPFAENCIPDDFFPAVHIIYLKKEYSSNELKYLTGLTFFSVE